MELNAFFNSFGRHTGGGRYPDDLNFLDSRVALPRTRSGVARNDDRNV